MAETSIKISLELADKAAQKALSDFIGNAEKSDKSLNKLKQSGSETFDEIALHIGKATGVYDIFAGNLAANLVIKSLEFLTEAAHGLFDTFIVEGVHAAQEQQKAINSLNIAFAQSGIYTKKASDDFIEFAEHLQKTTTFSNDAIIKNAALIQSLAQLDENGLKRATRASIDLAAALGKDLGSASELVAKAANGNITALGKMGIVIQKGQNNAETFATALTAIEKHFQGAATGQINTYSGALLQASNQFEDLQKQIGNLIVLNPAVIATIREFTAITEELTGSVGSQNNAFLLLVGAGLSVFLQDASFLVSMLDVVVRAFQTTYGVVQAISIPFAALTVPIRALSVGLGQATQEFEEFSRSAKDNLTSFGESGDGALSEIADDLLRLRDAADHGMDALAKGANGTIEPLNNTTGKMKELTEEMKRAQERLKTFAEDLVKQSESSKTSFEQVIGLAKLRAEAEIEADQSLLEQKKINQVQFFTDKAAIDAQFEEFRIKTEIDKFAADNQRLIEARAANVITESEFNKAKQQLLANFEATRAKSDAEYLKKDIDNKKKLILAEEVLQREKVQATADTFGALSSLMHTSSKELFEIGKAAAIASATINTYQAITKTMASVPYPFNIPLAIAQGIAGFVQVANIASTSPSFAQGGIVPGTSFSGDNVSANVNSGEMILNRNQQATLFKIANSTQGNSSLESKLDMLINIIAGKDDKVIVNIGGRTIVDSLRSEIASGRTFA